LPVVRKGGVFAETQDPAFLYYTLLAIPPFFQYNRAQISTGGIVIKASTITRRDVLKAAAVPVVFSLGRDLLANTEEPPPNIVFIVADDLGYADLSCYGRRDYKTPNIDRLAAEGMKFTSAYANSSVCSATRTALITGRYQYRIPVGLEEPLGMKEVGIPKGHPTLPSILKKAGYGTTLIGKWHLGSSPDYLPTKCGYDHFWGFRGGGVDYFSHKFSTRKEDPTDLWDDDQRIDPKGYITDLFGDRAVKVINDYAKAKQPFFLSLHFNAPHWPWEGPGDEDVSKNLRSLYHLDGGSQKTYAQMVRQLDLQVGRVMQTLQSCGISKRTIVIFTSDNGGERFSDRWPFTGMKTELLEGGLRVPALVRWPGHIRAGSVTDQASITMDWAPTLFELAGTRPDPDCPPDGVSLASVLVRNEAPIRRKLYWRYKFNGQRAVRDGEMKWLKIGDNQFLFNVVEDPLERANLKDIHPDVHKRMAADYEAWNATMLPEDPKATSAGWTADQLADHYNAKPK
jgi:arylsulfatase A-like enzyme